MTFNEFEGDIAAQFKRMVPTGLFRTGTDRDALWETYLASFTPDANPVYRKRTEHDCSACRHFIKTMGGVVTIVNNELVTLWDVTTGEKYQPVVDALAALVRGYAIENVFLHYEPVMGTHTSFSLLEERSITWRHFHVSLPSNAHVPKAVSGPLLSEIRSTYDVMLRGLSELTKNATETVLDLIAQNSLYRGEEHRGALEVFLKLQQEFSRAKNKELFCWSRLSTIGPAVARLRNTAIGTLLIDLSKGTELEDAVRSYERVVAPYNYKRPTALVSKAMIVKAQKTIEELGYMPALERRYARIEDITINNVVFADRSARHAMAANVFEDLAASTPVDPKKLGRVEEVPIDAFMSKVLPTASTLEVYFDNGHAGNLVSLIAPVDPTARGMFKWGNNFSWSYAGELTDSIRERVKRAGGSVTGDFRASLSWHNYDDLDLHLVEPEGGDRIFFGHKRATSGGQLDVDMNAGSGQTRSPVENITYATRRQMRAGIYQLSVNQYAQRDSRDHGFEVELEFLGKVFSFSYAPPIRTGSTVLVAEFTIDGDTLTILRSLPAANISRVIWGLPTQTFHPVDVVMFSPNHWDGQAVGNRHYFFMLRGCQQEGKARGFYNEFLGEELSQHRKVLEIVGSKVRTEESDRQLSGLGFSSTQRNSVLMRIGGTFSRVINVTF